MKKYIAMLAIVIPSLIMLLLASCQKEIISKKVQEETATSSAASGPVTRAYRDSFQMWLNFRPDIPGGWNPANPRSRVYWPGYGDGNATHMGKAGVYFNQYTLRMPIGQIYMFSRPVTMFFATELQGYNVPGEVAAIVLDGKGNSVWFKNDPNGIPSSSVSPTMVTFSGIMYIIGGTGKFEGATGEITINGYFNPAPLSTNPNALLDGTLWSNGWIRY